MPRRSTAPVPSTQSRSVSTQPKSSSATSRSPEARLADAVLIACFLGLAFLLGAFPIKDTDFWWHLKTGDLIRQRLAVPRTDWLTFGAEGHAWIDLHWLFQLFVSFGYQAAGVVGLNIAKCLITCAALWILLRPLAPGREAWPLVVGWLIAVLVLGGRMYLRPETLTFFYIACVLAILGRWRSRPRLAWLLPIVQLFWVNTQGLFVLGPVILTFALIDAALARGAFRSERRRWWATVLGASLATGLACLLNPYFLRGALFPLELARTMGNPIFEHNIAELMPLWDFYLVAGLRNLPLQLHLLTMLLGALSFLLVPCRGLFSMVFRSEPRQWPGVITPAIPKPEPADSKRKRKRNSKQASGSDQDEKTWRQVPFRLLLFVFFSALSFKATRNSHQFAAVVGTITAWNIADWVAAIQRTRPRNDAATLRWEVAPRLATLFALLTLIGFVGSGAMYAIAGEGRTIGLGEEPLWYPHDAVKAAAAPGAPERFVCIHDGHAALYEFANGIERKPYTDARLEVMGPQLFGAYIGLRQSIAEDLRSDSAVEQFKQARRLNLPPEVRLVSWPQEITRLGNPGILVDLVHVEVADVATTLLADPDWRCTWFDGIAAVFVPANSKAASAALDFGALHFRPPRDSEDTSPDQALATAKALAHVVMMLTQRGHIERTLPKVLLGERLARKARQATPRRAEPWKYLGLLEAFREPIEAPRFRMPFDPIFDLSPARATFMLREALALKPDDARCLVTLSQLYGSRGMHEAAYEVNLKLATLRPPNQKLAITAQMNQIGIDAAARNLAEMGPAPTGGTPRNQDERNRLLSALRASGRAATIADFLERSHPPEKRPWGVTDELATIWLHLGRPDLARAVWRSCTRPPNPAIVRARVAASYLVEDDFDPARDEYQEALRLDPNLFEAQFGLAILEQDAGNADAARAAARLARGLAPNNVARNAVVALEDFVDPYCLKPKPQPTRPE